MSAGDETFLLTLAGLLRAGICADPVPGYEPAAWRLALGVVRAR